MQISATCDYACRALLELALRWPNRELVQVNTIAKTQNIPIKYLTQILLQLKRAGLVDSVRGKDGGYMLAKPPDEISMGEVMREFGGPVFSAAAKNGGKKESVFDTIWEEVGYAAARVLDGVTFEDIAKKAREEEYAIIYHI